ncbi:MAG TPA: hypothetical protein VMS17_11370 [Gemmataceae bacterium]|nr:hypothetical protein [Gemmataceae bacterium]
MAQKQTHAQTLGSEPGPNGLLFVLFIPSKTDKGKDLPRGEDQKQWADAAGDMLTDQFGGSTEMPAAKGKWKNDDGEIITEPVILVHSYAQQSHVEDDAKMEELAKFLHRMGKRTQQGEIVVVIDNIMHRIRKFPKAQ